MMSLFSSFDFNYFWISVMMFTFLMVMVFNLVSKINCFNLVVSNLVCFMELFFSSMKSESFSKNSCFLFGFGMVSFFIFNLVGIWPYNFSGTSQMSSILFISLLYWIPLMAMIMIKNFKGFLSHLIPEGTPIYLTWFLLIIEVISNCIRPITLTVRLMANILAGHLLMILLFKLVESQIIFFFLYVFLNLVELFVSLIQAYIFFTMICLYYSEA